ncbi:hypothetical protein COPG_00137 [Colwellia phage 9A]|uniref:Uncharacterized protein n=1 Tax=Colwellia phage 9A TaxID=765765 RepID=I3UML8_9CAUD|nr:hypothetical protein COPG_00137 [Colwellia phage 9A]AFK66733.1 hypothetical protein COPG_00137 [Colwellia phage 9A]
MALQVTSEQASGLLSLLKNDKCTLGNAKIIREHYRLGYKSNTLEYNSFCSSVASMIERHTANKKAANRPSVSHIITRLNNIEEIMKNTSGCIGFKQVFIKD